MKYYPCPRCGRNQCKRNKRTKQTTCKNCGLDLPGEVWDRLKERNDTAKRTGVLKIPHAKLTDEEYAIVVKRREELWGRLARVLPGEEPEGYYRAEEVDLTPQETMSEVRRIILQYIAELEVRGEIPHGLTVVKVSPNPEVQGHLSVQFGLTDDHDHKDRDALIGFIGGRLSLL
jgi:hypothetical protein